MGANSSIGELAATTLENYSKTMADNVLNHNPVFERLNRKGNVKTVSGGKQIWEPLMYAENSTGKWYAGLELLDVSYNETIDAAAFDWKQYNANVVISGLDEIKNAGQEQKFDLVKARIMVAEKTMTNALAAGVFATGTGNDGKEIGGLQHLVADTPTSGTVGGIDRGSYSFWQNQYSAAAATSSGNIITRMNSMWLSCTRGNDTPDIIPAGSTVYGFYEGALQTYQRFSSTDSANKASGAFVALKYKTADVVYDENCDAKHMYFLNTDYLFLKVNANRNFKRGDVRMSVNQDAYVIPVFWSGNMTASNCNVQGVIIDD